MSQNVIITVDIISNNGGVELKVLRFYLINCYYIVCIIINNGWADGLICFFFFLYFLNVLNTL